MRKFYPEIDPYRVEWLQVSEFHSLYIEQSGNPEGIPVVYLHGGPGSGSNPNCRRYFNPDLFRIIQFDQRGSGASEPHASLVENTTQDLILDIEKIRTHLKVENWMVVGGSWGSTLAIAYTLAFPERVNEIVLRGVFLCREKELVWMYQKGASAVYPESWEEYLVPIAPEDRGDLLTAYYDALTSTDKALRLRAARAWTRWEVGMMHIRSNAKELDLLSDDQALAVARIECHFFVNKIFLSQDNFLLKNIPEVSSVPATLVQGRHDMICPAETAYEVHKAWSGSKLHIIDNAAHAYDETGIVNQIVVTTDAYARRMAHD